MPFYVQMPGEGVSGPSASSSSSTTLVSQRGLHPHCLLPCCLGSSSCPLPLGGSQKLGILPVLLTPSSPTPPSRNPEDLSEDLHLPHHTGCFLGLAPGKRGTDPLWPQFPKPSWGDIIPPPDVTQGSARPRSPCQRPPAPQPPTCTQTVFPCLPAFFPFSTPPMFPVP